MQRVFGLVFILILLTACGAPVTPGPELETEATIWQQVGNFPNTTLQPRYFDMAQDNLDNIYIAWIQSEWNTSDLYIHKWNGSEWIQLGNIVAPQTSRDTFAISVGTDNQPVIAVISSEHLIVKRWDGFLWQQIGEALSIRYPFGGAYEPSIAIDRNNYPFVTWVDGADTYVKRWDGESWVQLSGILDINANNNTNSPEIVLDRYGKPTVAWLEFDSTTFTNKVYVKSWNGYKWIQNGSFLNTDPSQFAHKISLSLDREGRPSIAWSEDSLEGNRIHVKRWDGNNWILLGNVVEMFSRDFIGEFSLETV